MSKVFIDCSGTLDTYGHRLADAARKAGFEQIIVWTWSTERAAKELADKYFQPAEYSTAKKDYSTPEQGDTVVDDDSEYWTDPNVCQAQYLHPTDFIAAFE